MCYSPWGPKGLKETASEQQQQTLGNIFMVPLDVASSFIHATIYPTLISFFFLHFANLFPGVPIWKKIGNSVSSVQCPVFQGLIFLACIDFILHVRNGLLPNGK